MDAAVNRHAQRNAVLIYLVPANRQFAFLGDAGIHDRVGGDFWTTVSHEMSQHLHKNNVAAALIGAIEKVGSELIRHFPCEKGGQNQISDFIGREK